MADPMDEAGPDGATPAAAWRVPDTLLILFVLALVAWAATFVCIQAPQRLRHAAHAARRTELIIVQLLGRMQCS